MLRVIAACFAALSAALASAQPPDWESLDRQAEQSYVKGDLKEAIRLARAAVDSATDVRHRAHSLDRLGFFEYTSGNLKDGETHLRSALDQRKTSLGTENADYAESANDLALLCRDSAKLAEARTLAEQAVEIRSRVLGPRDPSVAESLNTLGSVLGLMGDYDAAIARMEQAVDIHEAHNESAGEEFGTLCINLAGTYQRVGKYGKAEAMFQKGLDVLREKPGRNHPAYSASLVAFAYLQADLGHYAEAERLYNESGTLLRAQLGERHPVYAAFLNNRAALYAAIGNVSVAEADYRKALELKKSIFGPDALTVGASLRNLARLVSAKNRVEGQRLFQQAVDVYAKNPKPPPFDYTSALLGLGDAQRTGGDLPGARATLLKAERIAGSGLGPNHPLFAAVLAALSTIDRFEKRYPDAELRLKQAIAIVEQTQGENHPDLARYLLRLAEVYDAERNPAAAEQLYRRGLDISNATLDAMLAIGSESSRAAALANFEDPVPELIDFQRRYPAARKLAFEAVAQRKGRLLDRAHDWNRSARLNADMQVRQRFEQWKALVECQASLNVALGYRDLKPAVVGTCEQGYERLLHDLRSNWTEALGREANRAVKVLRQRTDALEAALSRELPSFGEKPARLIQIQARLRPDELLLECVETGGRYGAFLLGRSGDPQWFDLGPARAIDQPAKDLIAAANDWSTSMTRGETRAAAISEATARGGLGSISRILRPVMAAIEQKAGIARLRVAPDGMLNLVPFAAISDARGRYLIERFVISYLPASRDLIAPGSSLAEGTPVIALSPGPAEDLHAAIQEAQEVSRRIPRARLLVEGQATEQSIKELRRPALLHIAGHGVIRAGEDGGVSDPSVRAMSMAAIVLEEAYGRGGKSPEDGMLTALELQTINLEGTAMLVLSQCRMADGIPTSGDGVYGMRRAAAIAGARTFVAPLWNVSDATERALMERFYRELGAGASRADALRRAQLELLGRGRGGNVLDWAPVILSGDPGPLPHALLAAAR